MKRRALLTVLVALLLIGAYGAYVVSYPKYPEVKGCVNPFRVTKPVAKAQENWSKPHIFFKLATTKDFWKLAKPWDVDYKNVKVVRHTVNYNGEKISMLAMGIPLKDGKHVIAYYEFSKPVQGVKTRGYLFVVNEKENKIVTQSVDTNGYIVPLNYCPHECSGNNDCGPMEQCDYISCGTDWECAVSCCGTVCEPACSAGPAFCAGCIVAACPFCIMPCSETGTHCVPFHR